MALADKTASATEPRGATLPGMRCFIAIALPDEIRYAFAGLFADWHERDIHEAIRLTAPSNLHLTLRFLGHIDDAES